MKYPEVSGLLLQFKFLRDSNAEAPVQKSMRFEAFNQQFSTIRRMVLFPGGTIQGSQNILLGIIFTLGN
jgi:hypothetical protein